MEKSSRSFTPGARLRSFGYAMKGIALVIRYEHNARIHLVSAMAATAMGILLHINRVEWVLVILCVGLVIVTEIVNTAIEKLVDLVSPQQSEQAKVIKDISAAAVLVSACIALLTGLVVFLPHLIRLF